MKGKLRDLYTRAEQSEQLDSSVNGATRGFETAAAARGAFVKFRAKLLALHNWNFEAALTSYAHFDEAGRELTDRPLAAGDHIRIALKGTGKYDWVRVTEIGDGDDEIVLTVKPTADPTDADRRAEATSHFFTHEATNNFCLQCEDREVHFYVIGLEEKTNLGETANLLETARNAAVANLGYFFGIQKGEWKTFCHNFLELDEKEPA